MKKGVFLILASLIILNAVIFLPIAGSEDSKTEWTEYLTINGTCGTSTVRTHLQVNRTVVEITVNLTWNTEGGYANLIMHMEDTKGFHVEANETNLLPKTMVIRDFPDRGRWTLVVEATACDSGGLAEYSANVTMRNIALPSLELSDTEIEKGQNVILTLNSSHVGISRYYFDFGDGTDSGWTNGSSAIHTYHSSSDYVPKAKVRYSDGTESDLVDSGTLRVTEDGEQLSTINLMIMISIVILVIAFLAALFYMRKKML